MAGEGGVTLVEGVTLVRSSRALLVRGVTLVGRVEGGVILVRSSTDRRTVRGVTLVTTCSSVTLVRVWGWCRERRLGGEAGEGSGEG